MKRTPRDRALIEYGKAFERAAMIRSYIRTLLKERGYQITTKLLHEARDKYPSFAEETKDAWAKRRAVMLHKITCTKCDNFLEGIPRKSVHWCYRYNRPANRDSLVIGCEKYKPRKEEK